MKQLLLLLLISGYSTYSQSVAALKTDTQKMYEANFLMDFETIVSLSYPKMVENYGREAWLEQIEKHYENDEFRLRLQLETVPFQYSEVKKIEGKSFCVITCRNPIRYFFETKLTSETATIKTIWLQEVNKTKEVTFEPKRNSFNVRKTTTMLAVCDETTNNKWTFFNFDDEKQYQAFRTLFEESTQKELGL
ncbi:hypothetical protein [Flavobacterium sp. 25HG05S-40]|uniref:hypothetical protein n=1 Tax=Flavobacterium sp. 25HG05S-40 TaxID=3458682 RepID=UPI004044EE86